MSIQIEDFKLEFKNPVKAYNKKIDSKFGFIISLNFEGKTLQAEASTWNIDILNAVHTEISRQQLQNKLLEAVKNKTSIWDFQVDSNLECVRFAYSSLYLQTQYEEYKQCKINGFLDADDPEVLFKATQMSKFYVTKLKVLPKDEHKIALQELLKQTELKFRLDGNKNFSLEESVQLCENLPLDRIEYFEDPLQTPELLESFYDKTKINYSLDENKDLFSSTKKGLHSLVLKPMLIGGLTDIKKYLGIAPVVISSSYESEVGLKNLIQWAHLLNPSGIHGLGTYDIFKTPFNFNIKDGNLFYE